MFGIRGLARALLAAIFVVDGLRALLRAKDLAPVAQDVTDPMSSPASPSASTERLVEANAAVQVVGGALLALGIAPRLASVVLATSLVPTTLADHRFWEVTDARQRSSELTHFLKNAGLLGGLVFAALDTGGRPSVFWSGRQAAHRAGESIHRAGESLGAAISSTG